MRALALLLIVVNLAYLGWATLIDARAPIPEPQPLDPSVQRLVLASERLAPTSSAAASQPAVQRGANRAPTSGNPSVAAGSQCVSIGPFQDLTTAAQATATLNSAGNSSRQRMEQGEVWIGYWVHVPGFAKHEDAERAMARLKEHGIADVYISLSGGESASSVISLGVFRESDRAQRLLAEAKSLGFAAQIADRTRSGTVYWVDVEKPDSAGQFDFASLGAQPGKILRLEQRTCPQSAR